MPEIRGTKAVLLAAAAFVVITCAHTWPLATELRQVVPHDRGDPLLVAWILWWSTHTVPLTTAWWNAPAFYPAAGVLAFSENLLSLAPLTAPVLWITGSPILAYNVAFILSYVLSGLSAYALGYVLTKRHDAAFVAGVAFAFAPYRLSHLHHLQLLSSYWMPLALAALHLYLETGRRGAAILFAAAWLLQSLASGYYLFFLSLLVVLWIAWFAPGRTTVRQLVRLGACWAVAAVLLTPLLVGYRSIHARYGFKRSPVEIAYYSADGAGLLAASGDSLLWRGLRAVDRSESEMFPGAATAMLFGCALAIAARRVRASGDGSNDRRALAVRFYCLAALLMWALALGPRPAWRGSPLGIPGPYALLMHVPGFEEMRVPARLWMLAVLCASA